MPYTIQKNKLYYNGKEIYNAPADIDDTLMNKFNPQAIMIMYDGFRLLPDDYHDITNPILRNKDLQKLINQNVLCIDKEGNVIWRIESTSDYPHDHTHFFEEYNVLWVYRRDAREFQVDPATGRILQQRLGL